MMEAYLRKIELALGGLSGENYQEFLSGSGTWTVPENVEFVDFLIVGGGGGGGAYSSGYGGGGGGGMIITRKHYKVTPGASISYTVGAGGAGGSSAPGSSGGSSSFDGITAIRGSGGAKGSSSGVAGGGGGGAKTGPGPFTYTLNGSMYNRWFTYSVVDGSVASSASFSSAFGELISGAKGGNGGTTRNNAGNSPFGVGGSYSGGGASFGNGGTSSSPDAADNTGAGGASGENDATTGGNGGSGYILVIWR